MTKSILYIIYRWYIDAKPSTMDTAQIVCMTITCSCAGGEMRKKEATND